MGLTWEESKETRMTSECDQYVTQRRVLNQGQSQVLEMLIADSTLLLRPTFVMMTLLHRNNHDQLETLTQRAQSDRVC